MVSLECMHTRANLFSLDQRRQKQVLFIMFIYKNRHVDAHRIYARNTRAVDVYSSVRERYHNVKYKNSPYYKGSLLWETLPVVTRCYLNIIDYTNSLTRIYTIYDGNIF